LARLARAANEAGGVRAEEFLRHWVKSFLRDPGARNWLSDNRHPFRSLERDLNKYGSPKAHKQATVSKRPEAEVTPLSVEDQGKRASELAGLMKRIGGGGAA
jgi:hypothetical protein